MTNADNSSNNPFINMIDDMEATELTTVRQGQEFATITREQMSNADKWLESANSTLSLV